MSICAGLDKIIDEEFGVTKIGTTVPHYRHDKSCDELSKGRPAEFNAARLLKRMLDQILHNWEDSPRKLDGKSPSEENWRWTKMTKIAKRNNSPEKRLEKHIALWTGDEWVNQIPTASGLWNHKADKHRNVDLGHRICQREYELIELKVGSDTPLTAAIELLHSAVLYVFARFHYPSEHQRGKDLLNAEKINLIVLAPAVYYTRYKLAWLAADLNEAFPQMISGRGLNFQMDFKFELIPTRLIDECVEHDFERNRIESALANIDPVTW